MKNHKIVEFYYTDMTGRFNLPDDLVSKVMDAIANDTVNMVQPLLRKYCVFDGWLKMKVLQ